MFRAVEVPLLPGAPGFKDVGKGLHINDKGQIVGVQLLGGLEQFVTWNELSGTQHRGFTGQKTKVRGIDAAGNAVGFVEQGSQGGFFWSESAQDFVLPPDPGFLTAGLNDGGLVVGILGNHLTRWDLTTNTLVDLSAGFAAFAPTGFGDSLAVGNSGVVAGVWKGVGALEESAFYRKADGTILDLGSMLQTEFAALFPGESLVKVKVDSNGAINDSDIVVGEIETASGGKSGFAYNPAGGGLNGFTLLPERFKPKSINNAGIVVGSYEADVKQAAYLDLNDGPLPALNLFGSPEGTLGVPGGLFLEESVSVNNSGVMLAKTKGPAERAYLVIPFAPRPDFSLAPDFTSVIAGTWQDAATWGGDGVPGAEHAAAVADAVSLADDQQVQVLVVAPGGSLDLNGAAFAVEAGAQWKGSSTIALGAGGRFLANGYFENHTAAAIAGTDGAVFRNNGIFENLRSGDLQLGAAFENNGEFRLLADGAGLELDNAKYSNLSGSTLLKSAAGEAAVSVAGGQGQFDNQGAVHVENGSLRIESNVSLAQQSGTTLTGGVWSVTGDGAVLDLAPFDAVGGIKRNEAAIVITGEGAAIPQLGALAENYGALTLGGGNELNLPGNFVNGGDVSVVLPTNDTLITVAGDFLNSGTKAELKAENGALAEILGAGVNTGSEAKIKSENGGSLLVHGGVQNQGFKSKLEIKKGSTGLVLGTVHNSGQDAEVKSEDVSKFVVGSAEAPADIVSSGLKSAIKVEKSGDLEVFGNVLVSGDQAQVSLKDRRGADNKLMIHGDLALAGQQSALRVNQGVAEVQGQFSAAPSTIVNVGAEGVLRLQQGSESTGGTFEIAGVLDVGGQVLAGFDLLRGSGVVKADVVNTHTVAPGASAGTLKIEGPFRQQPSGSLEIELAGTAAGQHDLLRSTAGVQLAGELELTLLSGFTPKLGDQFDIVQFAAGNPGGSAGEFSSFDVSHAQLAAGLGWDLDYDFAAGLVRLSVIEAIALLGDYNADGHVDLGDFGLLKANFGGDDAAFAPGSSNGDGRVDLSDFGDLKANFGAAAAAVPEPAAGGLATLAAFMLAGGGLWRRLFRKRSSTN